MPRYYSSLNHFKIFIAIYLCEIFNKYINHLFSVLEFHPIKFISSSIFILRWIYNLKRSDFSRYFFKYILFFHFKIENNICAYKYYWLKKRQGKDNMGITLKLKINTANNAFISSSTLNGLGLHVDGAWTLTRLPNKRR